LNVAVNCKFSNLSQISAPVMSDSVRLWSKLVRLTKPASVAAAASTSRSVTGNFVRGVFVFSVMAFKSRTA
jgi:hypothetical protein